MCSSNNNSEKESAGLLSTRNTGGCFTDDASAALGNEPVNHADTASFGDAACDNLISHDIQCGKECGIVQGRIAREPIDRARYVVVDGSSGTLFACSRCSKQYIHRKSLNKHWNDKHADDSVDAGNYLPSRISSISEPHESLFNVALVRCPSVSKPVLLSCSSALVRSAVHSDTVCSAVPVAGQKTRHNVPRNKTKHNGNIGRSALWHSLAAIHANREPDLNAFYYAPMPAHTDGYHSGRASFLNQIFCDNDCKVLDLSVGSSAMHELSHSPAPDAPLDLSTKSKNVSLAGSEKAALPLQAVSCYKEISATNALVLNKLERTGDGVARFSDSTSDKKCIQSDSVAVLRRLHSGILTNATRQTGLAECSSSSVVADAEVEPAGKYLKLPNSLQFKNTLKMPSEISDDLATAEETHAYFGGMSRGGYIRCKNCDFSATSMLLFSRHVALHVRKPNILSRICARVQIKCDDSIDELEDRFFMWLGLQRTDNADVDSDKKSNDRCYYAAVDSSDKDETSDITSKEVATDISDFTMQEVQANGFGSHCDDESTPQKKNFNSDLVQQKPGGNYRRGLGLTTTESRDAAGRSWRRRRLRTCERCGYVTDNVTTLKRHEVKHGALGMYRCKLCDYTVNQQHILEYHTENVHGLSRQTGPAELTLFTITDTRQLNNVVHERCDGTTTSLIGADRQASLNKDLLETVHTGDTSVQRGSDVFPCSSEVAKLRGIHGPVNTCSMQKVMGKNVFASVTLARRHLLDAFGLQVGRGVCVRCGFRSLSAVNMKRHMMRHPHDRHACSQCSHTSPTAQLLLKHMRQQHMDCGNLAQKVYQCAECPFLAASPNRLQCHTQFHGAKLRHVCGKCSYSVGRANLMVQHRRLHLSALATVKKRRWLHCSSCPFRTINSGSLVNHERGHSSVNCQYMCSLCSFGTEVANVAFDHQRLHSC